MFNRQAKWFGSISDGDIRRALINKKSIDLKVEDVCQRKPKFLTEKQIDFQKMISFKKEGINILKTLSEHDLSSMIREANNAYYCKSKPLMSDNEYDILRETTLLMYPKNVAALEGHTNCSVNEKKKITLPYEMWSIRQ